VNDEQSGKYTIAVKLGEERAKLYFHLLTLSGSLSALFLVFSYSLHITEYLVLISIVFVLFISIKVQNIRILEQYNGFLKPLALTTFLYSLLLFLGFVL
jgi:1,4-dihydroxy-2-naphthoate octaprenyltransferase